MVTFYPVYSVSYSVLYDILCDSVGVKNSGSGPKIRMRGYFLSELSPGCYAILTSPKEGATAVYGYNWALF